MSSRNRYTCLLVGPKSVNDFSTRGCQIQTCLWVEIMASMTTDAHNGVPMTTTLYCQQNSQWGAKFSALLLYEQSTPLLPQVATSPYAPFVVWENGELCECQQNHALLEDKICTRRTAAVNRLTKIKERGVYSKNYCTHARGLWLFEAVSNPSDLTMWCNVVVCRMHGPLCLTVALWHPDPPCAVIWLLCAFAAWVVSTQHKDHVYPRTVCLHDNGRQVKSW